MMLYLTEKVSRGWTKIPNHDLEAFTNQKMDVPCLAFRKDGKEVYLHIFCNEFMKPFFALQIVAQLYTKFKLGKPAFKAGEPNWIHTIPLRGADLTEQETLLIREITHSLFWTVFMDYKKRKDI